ncbi:hypothetical protein JG687_00016368 [Phytophthora cactorum]|uniref:Uncharacterized protein n=1 Tax=Phytophthora cactorum TaxID=29920 RepID=A0A8T1TSC4_9STRA|nr:hypothetical protein JG687_00016368 [Phytophthora cactorum]
MLTPGKYERLHGDQRSKAILSILAALKGNGIQHRTKSSIRSKIRAIENQYLSAKQWLEERNISGDDVGTSRVDSDTENAVLSLCPHYRELMPIFRDSSYLNAMPSLTNADEVMDDNKVKSPRSKAKRIHEDEQEDRAEVARVLNCVRRTTYSKIPGIELNLSGGQDRFQRIDHCQLVLRDSDAQLPSEYQRQMADIKVNHAQKQSEAVLKNEDKMRAEMSKCDIEVMRGRGEVQLLLERMLARQTMKKEGIAKDEIDIILPLKEP